MACSYYYQRLPLTPKTLIFSVGLFCQDKIEYIIFLWALPRLLENTKALKFLPHFCPGAGVISLPGHAGCKKSEIFFVGLRTKLSQFFCSPRAGVNQVRIFGALVSAETEHNQHPHGKFQL